jgi:hypothetical protein
MKTKQKAINNVIETAKELLSFMDWEFAPNEIRKLMDNLNAAMYSCESRVESEKPVAYEWHNFTTGHCYVDYIPKPFMDEVDGYTKTPLYKR